MPIRYDETNRIFQIDTATSSYVMQVWNGFLLHLYWGAPLGGGDHAYMLRHRGRASFSPAGPGSSPWSMDAAPFEYPTSGTGDMRAPALEMLYADGSRATELTYAGHEIIMGKPEIPGLPHTNCERPEDAGTLVVTLEDTVKKLEVKLFYTVFEGYGAVVRSALLTNRSSEPMAVLKCLSASIDYDCGDYDEIHLHGSWARERHLERARVTHGIKLLESRRGASSHALNPFFALVAPDAGEQRGEAYGFALLYSGNFAASVELDQYASTRAMTGISPWCFSWGLKPGESFQSPEAALVFSSEGLGGMSHGFHRLFRDRLCRSPWQSKPRPVVVNNWEATYFDFDEAKLVSLAKKAKQLGIELLVMDDGWFARRNDDTTSLGDWFENREKLPGGLKQLAEKVKACGTGFGVWFEPEMVSPDSELYRAHPDWCLHIDGRRRTLGRNQLLLDMSRPDVCDYLIETLSGILEKAPIDYVKWDFNRNLTEVHSALLPKEGQGEAYHRFMLGTYRVLDTLTKRFPQVLFEGCSGGGGRFDAGMLYYTPQIWTSDDTDGVERVKIQYGTSLAYPLTAMSAHVSVTPNHQTGRATPFSFRGLAAMTGAFGYELDLEKLSEEDCAEVSEQTANFRRWQSLLSEGRLYRLRSPFEGNEGAWMVVSEDGKKALVSYFCFEARPNAPLDRLRLTGLHAEALYRSEEGDEFTGAQLMNFGLHLPETKGEYTSAAWYLRTK